MSTCNSTPNGIRTRVTCVKGRRPRPLDDGGRSAFEPNLNDTALAVFFALCTREQLRGAFRLLSAGLDREGVIPAARVAEGSNFDQICAGAPRREHDLAIECIG